MALKPPERASRAGEGDFEQASRPIRELIQEEIAQLDQNPALSDIEKAIALRTLHELEKTYGVALLDTQTATHAKLALLQDEIGDSIRTYLREQGPGRTDIVDLSPSLTGVFRRLQIERTLERVTKTSIETIGDFRKLSVEALLKLEDAHEGILLYIFTDAADANTKIDLEHFYWNPEAGAVLRVDFRGNMDAEETIGASELLSPSVRQITVYEKGNTNLARTSTQRIGLKGRNKYGTGFFDDEGYIPIYTGDVVIVGGADRDFERRYRKQDASLDYEAYERDHGVRERAATEDAEKRGLRTQKQYTPEALAALEARIEASGIRQRIVSAAMELLRECRPGAHCWDWVKQVYAKAGAKRNAVYRHENYLKKVIRGDPDFNDTPENPPMVTSLDSGDWVFTHNRNKADRRGDHSILFLRWIDKGNLIGEAISCPRGGCPGRIHRIDFKKTPTTLIMKPV